MNQVKGKQNAMDEVPHDNNPFEDVEVGTELAIEAPEFSFDEGAIFGFLNNEKPNAFFTSLDTSTPESRVQLFNAARSVCERLSDHTKEKIAIVGFVAQIVDLKDNNGKTKRAPRIVFIADDGKTYACVSMAMVNNLETIITLYGKAPWNPPVIIEPLIVQGRGENKVLTIRLHNNK